MADVMLIGPVRKVLSVGNRTTEGWPEAPAAPAASSALAML